jgi:copper transport protein
MPDVRRRGVRLCCRPIVLAASLIGALVLSLAFGDRASAHAAYDRSEPAANAIVPTAPSVVRIWFVEPLEPRRTGAVVYDSSGSELAGVTSQVADGDDYQLVVNLPPAMPNGTYSVAWHNVSAADGHPTEGYFAFTVGTSADVGQAVVVAGGDHGAPDWLRALSRWAALVGLAAAVAIWPIWLFVLRPAYAELPEAGERAAVRAQWLAITALLIALAGNVFALLVQSAAGGDERFGSAVWTTLTATRYGRFWLMRVALLAAYATALSWARWWPTRDRRPERDPAGILALALAAALPIPYSMISHAAAQTDGRTTAIAFDAVHLLGASIWVGGLYALTGVLMPGLRRLPACERRTLLARAIPRFSAVALAAWAALGLTGLYAAWLQVGSLKALTDTAYGHSLIAKLALLVPLLGLGALNLLVVGPGIRRSAGALVGGRWASRFRLAVAAEVVLATLVLIIVGRLIGQEPAREELAAQTPATITLHLDLATKGEARPSTLTISPGAVGPNEYRLEVGGSALPEGTEAVIRLALPEVFSGEKELKLTAAGNNVFTGSGSELAATGDWSAEVIVRKLGELEGKSSVAFPIAQTPSSTAKRTTSAWRFDWPGTVGLLFVVLGLAGLVAAWAVGRSPNRFRAALGGSAAIFLGAILLIGARIPAAEATLGGRPSDQRVGAGFATPVTEGELTATLEPASAGLAIGANNLVVGLTDATGAPASGLSVKLSLRSTEMEMGTTTVSTTEVEPGRYVAADVPLGMTGDWQVVVTVEGTGADPANFAFTIPVA